MVKESIAAYDVPERVASYDADMELMHPNRTKMAQVALDVLPFSRDRALWALDLGIGTGFFAERFLRRYPGAQVWAIDAAAAMVDLAKVRLGPSAERVHFGVGDFQNISRLLPENNAFDVVFSSYALHHLGRNDKEAVIRQAREQLKTDGWFLNADILVAGSPAIEQRIQEIRVQGIVERARGIDSRFVDAQVTRHYLDELEARDGDQPLTIAEDLEVLRSAGLRSVSIFWLEYREAVCGGIK